jgi:hypothetical protein
MSYVSYDFDRHPMPRSVVARIRERLAGKSGDAADTASESVSASGCLGGVGSAAEPRSALRENGTPLPLSHLRCSRDKE